MGKIKEREFAEFDDDEILEEGEGLIEADLVIDNGANVLLAEEAIVQSRRTWRDTEKYMEKRELYKIINDELYTGFDAEEFLEDED
jgi:hypothetical protein